MRLHSLRIKNYKCLKDVTLTDLPPFCAFIGANGTGKSTLFDAFSFLHDLFWEGVLTAVSYRGGYAEIVSSGSQNKDIIFELQVADGEITNFYKVVIECDGSGIARIKDEFISVEGATLSRRDSSVFKKFFDGPTWVLLEAGGFKGIGGGDWLGAFLGEMHISHVSAPDLKNLAHSSRDALARLALSVSKGSPEAFSEIERGMNRLVPGLDRIEVKETEDKRVILKFGDGAFQDPFLDRNVSDGTMKLFAYLVMLHAPEKYSFLCIEEPENYLYPTIQQDLAEEFRAYANRGGQVFVSTHSPDFLNALNVDEVVWLVKENGFTKAVRAKDDPQVVAYMNEGDRMGYLWKEGFFKGVHP